MYFGVQNNLSFYKQVSSPYGYENKFESNAWGEPEILKVG